jgi:uncharacterized RDD family membrane protein YckC
MAGAAIESSEYRYATFWQRAGAAAFDQVLLSVFAVALHAIRPGQAALYLSIFLPSLYWIYEVGTTARWGQTFGKMFTGVQIRRADFTRVGFGRALLRSAVWIALGGLCMFYELRLVGLIPTEIVLGVPFEYVIVFARHFSPDFNFMLLAWPIVTWELAELVTMLFHPKRRAVHDLIAGTVVVQSSSYAERRGGHRAQRVAAAIIGLAVVTALNVRGRRQPYRSRFPDGSPQGEYIPRGPGGGPKLVIYWPNGKVREVLTDSSVKDSRPRRREKTWQSFDESGALTRDIKFTGAFP